MLKFHLDENVDHAIALGLRNRGIDVTTTADAHLIGASDPEQLAHALAEGRVIITHGSDLLALHADGAPHAGVAFSTLRTRTIGELVLKLAALSRNFGPEDLRGHVEFL